MKLLLTLGLALLAAPADDGERWPFGATDAYGRGSDLYNLGRLGVKCSDADREASAPDMGSGPISVEVDPDDKPSAVGPERLRVEALFPGGPAALAGVEIGDVIVGIGGRDFGNEGSFEPLVAALNKAVTGTRDGEIDLRIVREGSSSPRRVTVTLDELEKAAGKPTSEDGRALLGAGALAWLAERQLEDGGYPQTLSGRNGAVCATSVAGLAWLAGGSSLDEGPYAENLAGARAFVESFVAEPTSGFGGSPGEANWDQTNWGLAHAAIFLGELHDRSPSDGLRATLQSCADQLVARQEQSGGWAHGPGGPNALGYLELNIVSGLALSGLGLAMRAGCEVDEDALELATDYIDESSNGGAVGYSERDGQRGQGNIGRSAAVWLGYQNLDLGRSSMGKSLADYVKRNVGYALDGHASLMQHIFLAGVAAAAHGRNVEKTYWESMEQSLVLAWSPDGSFQPRPWHESVSMGSNSDVSFGEVWTTAAWTVALLAAPDERAGTGLPAWCGR